MTVDKNGTEIRANDMVLVEFVVEEENGSSCLLRTTSGIPTKLRLPANALQVSSGTGGQLVPRQQQAQEKAPVGQEVGDLSKAEETKAGEPNRPDLDKFKSSMKSMMARPVPAPGQSSPNNPPAANVETTQQPAANQGLGGQKV